MPATRPSWVMTHAVRPRPGATHVCPEDTRGVVNVSWHPNRATCAVSVGRSVFLVDGATGAVLRVARTPLATLALAYAPAKLGARLCALLRDGSLHAVDFEDDTRTAADAARSASANRGGGGGGGAPVRRLHPPTVNVKKRGLAPADRRGLICFGGDAATPWAVFALAGDVSLRAARVAGDDAGNFSDPGSPGSSSSAPSSPSAFSSASGSRSSSHTYTSGSSGFGSLFGKKRQKHPPLLKIKGEHKKPLACVCSNPEAVSDEHASLIYAGYADGAVFVYDLKTQTCVGSASLPRAVVTRKKGGTYASTDDASDPLGIDASKTEKTNAEKAEKREPPGDGDDISGGPSETVSKTSKTTKSTKSTKSEKKTVRSKVPPPCTAMSLVARGGDEPALVVADVAGRLTSWSALPKPPEPADANFSANLDRGFGSDANARDSFSSGTLPSGKPATKEKKPVKMKRRKPGPGGAPALELLSGVRASESNAPAFALGALPDGRGVAVIAGERSRVTGAAFCVLKTFIVNLRDGSFDAVVGGDQSRLDPRAASPFPPLPPAAHRVALASHPTQTRVAAAAAAVAPGGGDDRGGTISPLVKTSDAPPFTAFFASGDEVSGSSEKKNTRDCSYALRDRVEAEHVSTLAAASAQPPPRRARVFYLGDEKSVWSVAFAEGPKASRRCGLPPPPSQAQGAVPARLRVAVTAGDASPETERGNAIAAADGRNATPKSASTTRELFLTLWRVPNTEHCALASVVDGATGASLVTVPARDAVFVAEGENSETGYPHTKTISFAALDAAGASVEARSIGETSGHVTARLQLTECLASQSVSAYRLFPGPAQASVAAACVADGASVFAVCPFSLGNAETSTRGVATLALDKGERVLDAAWQLIGRGDGARDTTPWGGLAVLTNERLLMCEYTLGSVYSLRVRAQARWRGSIFSFLWVGPALLFSHADGVSVLGWDGVMSTACACGVGGGNELALSAATEDAILLFLDAAGTDAEERNSIDFPRAVPFFRPVSVADALCIGWGSLVSAKRRDRDGVSDGLQLVAKRAVASALARHDASRVSRCAMTHVADSLLLPGLAANVARRATHLSANERARFLVSARNAKAALEMVRGELIIGADPEALPHGDASNATTPHVPHNDSLFIVSCDACEAASAMGDAASAFDAACLAFGASGGSHTEALERLLEYGVAVNSASDGLHESPAGDGGFAVLDALVETTLAPGAAREACASAARRRVRREQKSKTAGKPFRLRPFDRAGSERAKQGDTVPLGWSAVPASVFAETIGAPTAETSRVSVLTHADALGRRIKGASSFLGGVEGDREKSEEDESEEEDPFPWSKEEEEDDDGDPFRSGAFHPSGSFANEGDPFAQTTADSGTVSFAAFSPPSSPLTNAAGSGFEPGGGQGHPGGASFGALALPGPSEDPFGAPPGAPGFGTAPGAAFSFAAENSEADVNASRPETSSSIAAASPFAFGDGFASGFGGGDAFATNEQPVSFAPFGTPVSLPGGGDISATEQTGTRIMATSPPNDSSSVVADDVVVAADPFAAAFATSPAPAPVARSVETPSQDSRVPFTRTANDDTNEDPFGEVSDEDPFGDAEEEEEEEETFDVKNVAPPGDQSSSSTTTFDVNVANDVVARTIVQHEPPAKSLRPRVAPKINQSHEETLRWALRGMDALERNDYETCELAFKAATKLAVAGRAPSVKAAVKCRSYAVAARALRFARAVSETIDRGTSFNVSKLSGQNLAAAIELARLARHVAALPLDVKHRACLCRFAAAWHFRLGDVESGSKYLAAAAAAAASASTFEGEDGERARVALASLTRCARAMERGAKPGGPFLNADEKNASEVSSADLSEVPGWVCAATLRSLRANHPHADGHVNPKTKGLAAVECARCRTAHCEAFALGDGATCAVCDEPFRTTPGAETSA